MSTFKPLYKFREVNDNSLKSIKDNFIWFSQVEDFNDPFEFYYNLDSGINKNNFKEYLKLIIEMSKTNKLFTLKTALLEALIESKSNLFTSEVIQNAIKGIEKELISVQMNAINLLKTNCKVFSLSLTNKHPLLWGHYADGLKGMCIEYDFNLQPKPLNFCCYLVKYKSLPFKIILSKMAKKNVLISNYYERVYATKNNVWSYEEEFRLISNNEDMKGNRYSLEKNVIRSIFIGEKMSIENQHKVKEAIKGRDIQTYKAIAVPSKFKIEIIDFKL